MYEEFLFYWLTSLILFNFGCWSTKKSSFRALKWLPFRNFKKAVSIVFIFWLIVNFFTNSINDYITWPRSLSEDSRNLAQVCHLVNGKLKMTEVLRVISWNCFNWMKSSLFISMKEVCNYTKSNSNCCG